MILGGAGVNTSPRQEREELERRIISPRGILAAQSRGREMPEEECRIRTCFQRDVDRIVHSKSFRRLKHKTQVFLQPEGDHYRTRMTHTLEVSRIARTIARALMLNEDLTEAASLGHDIGHTPFGHAGERALNELCGGFRHYEQSLRVVDRLEKDGRGLNLTYEVRMAILNHTTGAPDDTLEAKCVRLADRIAYINHDVDDAIRAGILKNSDLPENVRKTLGESHSVRINTITTDLIDRSFGKEDLSMSPDIQAAVDEFHEFLFAKVYRNPRAKSEESKVIGILGGIYGYYMKNPDKLPEDFKALSERDGLMRAVCDYVAGMTDKYAISKYSEIFIPASWQVV